MTARTRVSPHLKWLLNERAALRGEVDALFAREERTRAELAAIAAERRIRESRLAAIERILAGAESNVACPNVVCAWKGRYGERGALQAFLLQTLTDHAPHALDTLMLLELVVNRFELRMETAAERKRYCDNTLRPTLRKLQSEGLVEALRTRRTGRSVREWRRIVPEISLSELRRSTVEAF
jgi:hypothetical protein